MPTVTVPKLALHPLCEIIPPCTEQEYKELKEDIEKNGLQVSIKLFENQILDGRSRYKACVELGKECKPEIFSGTYKDALTFVISMNVKRRHLSASQRALIAAKLVNSKVGGDHSVKLPNEITQQDVAALSGVAVKTVTDATKVLKRPELAEKVLKGELAVAKAAEQIRKEEGKSKKQTKAEIAAKAYHALQEKLIDALGELKEVSSFAHAHEYAEKTKTRLDETIEAMRGKKAA